MHQISWFYDPDDMLFLVIFWLHIWISYELGIIIFHLFFLFIYFSFFSFFFFLFLFIYLFFPFLSILFLLLLLFSIFFIFHYLFLNLHLESSLAPPLRRQGGLALGNWFLLFSYVFISCIWRIRVFLRNWKKQIFGWDIGSQSWHGFAKCIGKYIGKCGKEFL